ncbi:MAG: phytoene desaturase [Planctomycetaceae bacterium]|nr:phytoene desaturase [Planctomycetaceae bacterium]
MTTELLPPALDAHSGAAASTASTQDRGRRVAIIGGGLGGLSAAIHLRITGFDVTVLEANERVGGRASRIELEGFAFDTGPSLLNYPWVFEQLFAAAGRKFSDYVELRPVEPSVSFQWPEGRRLELSSDYSRLLAAFSEFEPSAGPRLAAWLQDCSEKYRISFDRLVTRNADGLFSWLSALSFGELRRTAVWRSLDSELKRFFKSRHIREALGAYGMYLGGSPFTLPGIFTILAYGELAYGLWLPKGGIYGLVRGIERLALELGVKIETSARVKRIVADGGRVLGVEMASGAVRAFPLVVSNVDVPTTQSELLPEEMLARGRREALRTRMTPGVMTFYWGVRGQVRGLGHHTIFLPGDYRGAFKDLTERGRIPADLPFYVAVPSATDASMAPAGDSSVFVLVPTPVLSELGHPDWDSLIKDTKARVLKRLAAQGAELPPERIVVEQAWTPETWRARFGLYNGSAFGAAHNLFQVGPFRAPNWSKALKGLYFVGAGTTPGTGMPMVVLSGRLVAERMATHVL